MRTTCLLLALFFAFETVAQPAQLPLRFEHFSVEEGLSQSVVTTVLQDRQGFLWIGTRNGLNRYDGYRFRVFKNDPNDATSLSSNTVWALHEDADGNLWVGTHEGLSRFDRATETFVRYQQDPEAPTSLNGIIVQAIEEDDDGNLWVGTRHGGLSRLNPGSNTFKRYPHGPDSTSNWEVNALYRDQAGQLWVGSWGIHRYDPAADAFVPYLYDPAYPDAGAQVPFGRGNEVFVLHGDRAGQLWVGTSRTGVQRFDPATGVFTAFLPRPDAYRLGADAPPTEQRYNRVFTVYADSRDRLWVGTSGDGLLYLDQATGTFHLYRHNPNDETSLSNDQVETIYEDRMGVLWVGTFGGGINRADLAAGSFTYYGHNSRESNTMSGQQVWTLYEDHQDMLWIGTVRSGLNRLDRTTGVFTHYRHDPQNPNSLSIDNTRALAETRDGRLWVGTTQGLSRLDPTTGAFTHYRSDPSDSTSLSHRVVRTLFVDREGTLWIGTTRGGLSRYNAPSDDFTNYRPAPSDPQRLSYSWIDALYEDDRGRFWVGSRHGLHLLDRATGTFTRYQHDDEYHTTGADVISAISGTEDGAIWLGTQGGGLLRFDPETEGFLFYTEQNSALPNNNVYGVLTDEAGFLWISTDTGLARFDPRTGSFRNYDSSWGLQSLEFNGNAYHKGRHGELFFGGINGFNAFFPEDIIDNPYPPEVVLTGFSLFNRSVRPGDGGPLQQPLAATDALSLAYNENDISFDFVALHFSSPARNRYAFMLENYDETWRDVGDQRKATYTNLSPGAYVFRVKAANRDGVWNEEGVALPIVIAPPWWKTWWAYGLYGLLLIFGIVGIDRSQRRRLVKKERTKAEIEQARLQAAAAELQARTLQAEGDLLKSELKFFAIVASAKDAVISADSDGNIMFWNKQAEVIFGYTEEEALGQPLTVLMPQRYRMRHEKGLQRYLATNEPRAIGSVLELHGLRKDGSEFPVSFSLSSWQTDEGTYFGAILRDITARKEAEEKLKTTQAQLAHSEKLASLGQLTAGIAHEIKNPLNFVNNFAHLTVNLVEEVEEILEASHGKKVEDLKDDLSETLEDIKLNASSINQHGRRADNIISAMMDHARGGTGKRRATDLNALLDEYVNLTYQGKQAQWQGFTAEVERHYDAAVGEVELVPQEMGRVFLNLLDNACDAVRERAASAEVLYAPRIMVATRRIGGQIEIRITDNGPGIPSDIHDTIFEPFFTTKPTGEGNTGLGLSLSYDIVTLGHGGTLAVESKKGEGATFVITLPDEANR